MSPEQSMLPHTCQSLFYHYQQGQKGIITIKAKKALSSRPKRHHYHQGQKGIIIKAKKALSSRPKRHYHQG